LIDYLRQRGPFHYILLFVLTFVLNGSLFFELPNNNIPTESLISDSFSRFIEQLSPFWYKLISLLSIYFIAIFVNFIFSRFKLIDEINLFPAFIFLILISMFPGIGLFSPAILSFAIMLLVIYNLLLLFDMERAVQHLFFTSFYLSIASVLFFPVAVYFIFILIAYPILKRPQWRELLISIIGMIIPLHFILFYQYWINNLTTFIADFFEIYQGFRLPIQWYPVIELVPVAVLFIVLFIGFVNDTLHSFTRTVRKARFMRVFGVLIILSVLIFVFFTSNYIALGIFILLPITYFLAIIFTTQQGRYIKIIFALLVLTSIAMQIGKVYM